MTTDQLRLLRERLHLQDEVPEEALADDKEPPYISLAEDSRDPAVHARPPARPRRLAPPPRRAHQAPARAARPRRPSTRCSAAPGKQAASTTTAFTRLLRNLCRDPKFGPRVVPIIPDEARTFGMDSLFKEFGIYASQGQQYEPVDHALLLSYTESQQRADPRGGHHRGRVDGQLHRRRHELRHPGRADGAVLHLLLDVRLPAGRRPHLAGQRRPGPGLPPRRHRRAARRCSARACSTRTATASCWRRSTRPPRPTTPPSPTRWPPSCATACAGCGSRTRTSSTT